MRLTCPHCGERDQSEFSYLGDGSVMRPPSAAGHQAMFEYVYLRDNPSGEHLELWYHAYGCRSWVRVRRNVRTHEVLEVRLASLAGERPL